MLFLLLRNHSDAFRHRKCLIPLAPPCDYSWHGTTPGPQRSWAESRRLLLAASTGLLLARDTGRRQTLTLLLYPGLGPTTEHLKIKITLLALQFNIHCTSSLGTPLNVAYNILQQFAEIWFPSRNDSMTVCTWLFFFLVKRLSVFALFAHV